jgi:hypothetical protein
MMTRLLPALMVAGALLSGAAPGPSAARPERQPVSARPGAPDRAPLEEFKVRLGALTPSDPAGYFLLAEEVADGADDPDRVALAQTLYALAFELYRAAGDSPRAASCAIGLASTERLERSRRWLEAVAGALDRRYALPDWAVAATASISDETALKAATVLGLARAGEGREARKLYEQPGVADLMRRYERAMGSSGETGALSRLDKYMDAWPCRECGNARVVGRPGENGPELRLCPTCKGNPGPRLTPDEYLAQLRFEAALLNGIQRSWAAQITVDQGAPLRDPDPAEVGATYGVDASRAVFRDGAWVSN